MNFTPGTVVRFCNQANNYLLDALFFDINDSYYSIHHDVDKVWLGVEDSSYIVFLSLNPHHFDVKLGAMPIVNIGEKDSSSPYYIVKTWRDLKAYMKDQYKPKVKSQLTVSLSAIERYHPCNRGWEKLLSWAIDRKSVSLREIYDHQGPWDCLWAMRALPKSIKQQAVDYLLDSDEVRTKYDTLRQEDPYWAKLVGEVWVAYHAKYTHGIATATDAKARSSVESLLNYLEAN